MRMAVVNCHGFDSPIPWEDLGGVRSNPGKIQFPRWGYLDVMLYFAMTARYTPLARYSFGKGCSQTCGGCHSCRRAVESDGPTRCSRQALYSGQDQWPTGSCLLAWRRLAARGQGGDCSARRTPPRRLRRPTNVPGSAGRSDASWRGMGGRIRRSGGCSKRARDRKDWTPGAGRAAHQMDTGCLGGGRGPNNRHQDDSSRNYESDRIWGLDELAQALT